MEKQRIIYLDFIKGYAILLVILGHCIQYNITNGFDNNIIFRYIYSFHMPLFMLVSGYITKYMSNIDFKHFLTKKTKHLIVPFLSWAIIGCLIYNRNIITTIKKLFFDPSNGGLWFLTTLFSLSLIICILNIISNKIKINFYILISIFSLFFVCAGAICKTNILGIRSISWYYIFYVSGIILKQYENQKIIAILYKNVYWELLLFVIFAYFFRRSYTSNDYSIISKLTFFANKLFVAFLGIMSSYFICKKYLSSKDNKIIRIFSKIGQKTLGIYAIQFIAIKFLTKFDIINIFGYNCDITIHIIFDFILAAIISYYMTLTLEKNKYTSKILLGKQ